MANKTFNNNRQIVMNSFNFKPSNHCKNPFQFRRLLPLPLFSLSTSPSTNQSISKPLQTHKTSFIPAEAASNIPEIS
jgi:hypothetical protein